MAPRDPWADVPDAVERIRLLTSHQMTIPEILHALRIARVRAPVSDTGARQEWTKALVSAGQEYIRRQAAATPPPPPAPAAPTDDAEIRASVLATLDRVIQRQSELAPGEWEAWVKSPDGRAALRQVQAMTMLLQARTALEGGMTASAPKIAEVVARLTATMDPGATPETQSAAEAVATLDEAAVVVLDALPALRAWVGRDAILRAIGLREHHVTELAPTDAV